MKNRATCYISAFLALIILLLSCSCAKKGVIKIEPNLNPPPSVQAETEKSADEKNDGKTDAVGTEKATPAEAETEAEAIPEPVWDMSLYRAPDAVADVPDLANIAGISVKDCSFTAQKNVYVIIGSCDMGVTVKAYNAEGQVIDECEAYKGWFSVRSAGGKGETVTLREYYGNEQLGSDIIYTAQPRVPDADMWGIIAGKNYQFWLDKAVPYYTGSELFTEEQLDGLAKSVSGHVKGAKSMSDGCEIIYMIVPTVMSVYPELVPDDIKKGDVTKLDQIVPVLRDNGATVIDLKDVFIERRNDSIPLYAKLDSHWTEYGAYVAYVELFKHVAKRFPEAAPKQFDEFSWDPKYYISGDATYYLQMDQPKILEYSWLRTPKFEMHKKISLIRRYLDDSTLAYAGVTEEVKNGANILTVNNKLPNMLVYRDSFGIYLYDIMLDRCNRSVLGAMWAYNWNPMQIKSSDADYVVYLVTEWNIDSLL